MTLACGRGRRSWWHACLVVLLVLVGGCGSPPPAHNAADVLFLQQAITHHGQGVALADLAASRPVSAPVRDLAAAIAATQRSEITQMTAWLAAWGEPIVHSSHTDGHHGVVPAMELVDAADGEFERKLLTVLTGHQHGAVELAQVELVEGVNEGAKRLADRVVRSRAEQISQMLTLAG